MFKQALPEDGKGNEHDDRTPDSSENNSSSQPSPNPSSTSESSSDTSDSSEDGHLSTDELKDIQKVMQFCSTYIAYII